MENNLPQRKPLRAKWLDYNEGMYFITVCTRNKQHYFGEINNGEIFLSSLGMHLSSELEKAPLYQLYKSSPVYYYAKSLSRNIEGI